MSQILIKIIHTREIWGVPCPPFPFMKKQDINVLWTDVRGGVQLILYSHLNKKLWLSSKTYLPFISLLYPWVTYWITVSINKDPIETQICLHLDSIPRIHWSCNICQNICVLWWNRKLYQGCTQYLIIFCTMCVSFKAFMPFGWFLNEYKFLPKWGFVYHVHAGSRGIQ